MKTIIYTTLIGVLGLSLVACSSSKHLLKHENFDAAIGKAIQQMRGANKRAKIKHLNTLAESFNEVQRRDLIKIQSLESSNRPGKWVDINRIYQGIIARQDKVRPYEAHAAEWGIDLSDAMQNFNDDEYESRNLAAEFMYTDAERLIQEARLGNKLAAREAVYQLECLEKLFDHYRDKEAMFIEALELGTDHILVHLSNESTTIIPNTLNSRILDFGVENLNDQFHIYTFNKDPQMTYDYMISINILDLQVSPESERYNSYTDSKEIPDGFDYVLDANGNVLKDSSGNDVKVDRYKTISATIKEVEQHKSLLLTGNVEFFDMQGNKILSNKPISAEARFENFAATFVGDKAALSDASLRKIGNAPVAFPSDPVLLRDAADLLRPIILRTIQGFKLS